MQVRGRLAWIPAFLLGFVAATAGELAGGLLLYSDEGFLRALTLLLAVELGGLGAGLWVAGPTRNRDPVGVARRRWLFCLVAYTAAAAFAAAWQMGDGLPASFLNQGLGLALLGGLPLYAAGAALGGVLTVERSWIAHSPGSESEHPEDALPLGAVAALGGAAGVLTTGFLLIPLLQPVSIYLLCVVLVSAAALVHGRILEESAAEPDGAGGPEAHEDVADADRTGRPGLPGSARSDR